MRQFLNDDRNVATRHIVEIRRCAQLLSSGDAIATLMISRTRSSQTSLAALSLYFTTHETACPTLSCRLYQRAAIFANIFAIAVAYAIAIYAHVYVCARTHTSRDAFINHSIRDTSTSVPSFASSFIFLLEERPRD